MATGRPGLIGLHAMGYRLDAPNVAMRVGRTMALGIWSQNVIIHRDSVERSLCQFKALFASVVADITVQSLRISHFYAKTCSSSHKVEICCFSSFISASLWDSGRRRFRPGYCILLSHFIKQTIN